MAFFPVISQTLDIVQQVLSWFFQTERKIDDFFLKKQG